MKNVAKCDTWCELQNPVNHRVFERKLRPRDPPEGTPASRALEAHPRSVASRQRRGHWPSEPRGAVGPSERPPYVAGSGEWWATAHVAPSPVRTQGLVRPPNEEHAVAACVVRHLRTDTPGQAGLPAEFKHINKRRRRNLQGFP